MHAEIVQPYLRALLDTLVAVAVAVSVAEDAELAAVLPVETDVSVPVLVEAADCLRMGALIPEGPVIITGACVDVAGATATAPPVPEDAAEGEGALSAGCISMTQLVAKAMSKVVSVNLMALGFTVASGADNKAPPTPVSQTTTRQVNTGQPGHRSI